LHLNIVIVSYQVKERLRGCLESLAALDAPSFDVTVVDNASTDGSVVELAPLFPRVRFVSMDRNTGFGMACNRGAEFATSPWILFLNPDTVVFPETLVSIMEFADSQPRAGIVGCRILDGEGNLQLACRRSIPTPTIALWRLSGLSLLFPKHRIFARYNLTYLDPAKDAQVEAVSGSFLLIRSDVYRQLGGFDEDFFLYGEDLDLCLRTSRIGWEVWYCGQATIIHHKGRSAATRPIGARWDFYHAMVTFAVKNFGVGKLGRFVLETAALALTGLEFVAKQYRDVRSWCMDLLLANGLFFVISSFYLFGLSVNALFHTMPQVWLWNFVLSFWFLLGLGAVGMYRSPDRAGRRIVLGLGIAVSGFLATGFFLRGYAFSRVVFFLATIVVSVSVLLRNRLKHLNQKAPRRILVLGLSDDAVRLWQRLQQWPNLYHVVGRVAELDEVMGVHGNGMNDLPLGRVSSLEPMVRALEIDALVLPASRAASILPTIPGRLPSGVGVLVEVVTEGGPVLLGDVTLDRSTIAEPK
jgi:O-antigen biosynthesis protein